MAVDPIIRLNAALVGRYRIERELGEGGMATVYLAADLKHERKVALKVLKPELAAVVGAERFLAEIKTTANLQHPHILPLFDSGEADSFVFYVMPYVEGESLRERLDREHQLPVDEAVRIATDLAEALHSAHKQGVIHRDIKPANILLSEGRPLIADFGIALAVSAAGGGRLTETGLSLGTPHYMSPEQATGDQTVGPTTDIYALGCVLYEMLVGDPPYVGSTAQAVLANILTRDAPPPTEARPSVPANVDGAIRKALARLPADRFQRARLFAEALGNPSFRHGGVQEQHHISNAAGRWKTLAVASLAAAVISLFALSWATFDTEAITTPVLRVSMALSGEELVVPANGSAVTISPDGSTLLYGAFQGTERDRRRLWARRLDEFEATPLAGTEEGVTAAFSPDGQRVAFTQGAIRGPIQLVSVAGGPRRSLGDDVLRAGIDWGPDGNIYYVRIGHGISRVQVADGATEIVTTLDEDAGETGHRWIDVLPDGRAGVFSIGQSGGMDGWKIGVVRFGENGHHVLTTGLYPRYVETGHLLWVLADGTLMAAPFDAKRMELTGQGVSVLDDVNIGGFGAADFAVSENGTLVYLRARSFEETPVWVARDGTETEIPGEWDGALLHPRISPDARRMSLSIQQGNGVDIWMKELDAGPLTRLTFSASNYRASWTADGGALTFLSDRDGQGVWRIRADGSGSATIVYDDERFINEAFTTPNARWLVYRLGSGGGRDLMARPIAGEGEPVELATTDFEESAAAVSPDGRWLAYMSNESGQNEIYVRPFPSTSESRQLVSTSGGREPVWARSGSELFYKNASNQLVAVEVRLHPRFVPGDREVMFSTVAYTQSGNLSSYDVSPDGLRFLMIRSRSTPGELKLIQNFFEELKRLVPN